MLLLTLLACSGRTSLSVHDQPTVPDWDPTALSLYGPADPFLQPIAADSALSSGSATQVQGIISEARRGAQVVVSEWTVPVYVADGSTPTYDISLDAGWAPYSTLIGVPIPDHAVPDPQDDGHLAIIDTETHTEYDFWQLCGTDGSYDASWGNLLPSDGDGIFAHGYSARGSGFALVNGLIWPHELERGEIDHALLFSYDLTRKGGPVSPATESDGTGSGDDTLPEGARIQLEPSLDVGDLGLDPWEETIARALQTYGAFLGDDGGGFSLYAVHPASFPQGEAVYDGLLPVDSEGMAGFSDRFPFEHLRVLAFGAQDDSAADHTQVDQPERFR